MQKMLIKIKQRRHHSAMKAYPPVTAGLPTKIKALTAASKPW
jgi:hypothetical protein